MKYAWMKEHRGKYSVAAMSRCFNVVPQGFYQWLKKETDDESEKVFIAEIKDVMKESRHTYGNKRVAKELKERGFRINHKKVARLKNENDIHCKRVKKRKKTTDSGHGFPASENRLNRCFKVSRPNRAWVGDITYLRYRDGWIYLSIWLDLYSRKIVGWSVSKSLASGFVCSALKSALQRRPGARPLIHSDRGVQYASNDFRRMLWQNKLRQSMSRKGDCWDNSVAESFFGTLKSELVFDTTLSEADVRSMIFDYIEVFYNRKRLHSTLGFKSPENFENQYWSLEVAS